MICIVEYIAFIETRTLERFQSQVSMKLVLLHVPALASLFLNLETHVLVIRVSVFY